MDLSWLGLKAVSLRLLLEAGTLEWVLTGSVLLLIGVSLFRWRSLPKAVLGVRVLGLIALAWVAARPSLVVSGVRTELPKVAVLVDASRGMASSREGRTDFARAVSMVESSRGSLEAFAQPYLYLLGERAVRSGWGSMAGASPSGPLDVAQGLADLWREHGETLAAVWFFSNGVGDRSKDLTAALSRLGCPVYTVGVGSPRQQEPFRVESVRAPEFAFLHLPFPLGIHWSARGLRGTAVRVRVFQGSQELAVARLPIEHDFETRTSTLSIVSPALGSQTFSVEFSPEGTQPIARAKGFRRQVREFALETVRQKLRILYLAGHPSFEYSALRHYLKSNPNFEMVSFVILRNPENIVPVPESELSLIPFPAQEIFVNTLNQFDLFILEDFSYARFQLPVAYLGLVRQFVERGGGLLAVGGPSGFSAGGYRGTPLEELLPVEIEDAPSDWVPGTFLAKATNPRHPLLNLEGDAEASARAWSALPAMDGYNRVHSLRPGATALLCHPTEKLPGGGSLPVLASRELGRGRVLLLTSPSTWRWKLLAGLKESIGGWYEAFWQRCIQYLTGSLELSKVRLAPLVESPVAGEAFTLLMHVLDETFSPLSDPGVSVEVKVRAKDVVRVFGAREVGPGLYQADIPGLAAGAYQIQATARYRGRPWGSDSRSMVVRESAEAQSFNRLLLEDLARRSRGSYCDWEAFSPQEWLKALPQSGRERRVQAHVSLWASANVLFLLLALFLMEWYLRRRSGYW